MFPISEDTYEKLQPEVCRRFAVFSTLPHVQVFREVKEKRSVQKKKKKNCFTCKKSSFSQEIIYITFFTCNLTGGQAKRSQTRCTLRSFIFLFTFFKSPKNSELHSDLFTFQVLADLKQNNSKKSRKCSSLVKKSFTLLLCT